ncbi:MAG: DUF6774 domain-containing protein, partial [Ruminococcus sp.]
CEITAAVTAVANFISCNLKSEEISLLGSVFNQLGDTLATIAAQKALCSSVAQERNESNKDSPE